MNGNYAHFEAFATRSAPQEWIERGEDKNIIFENHPFVYLCNDKRTNNDLQNTTQKKDRTA